MDGFVVEISSPDGNADTLYSNDRGVVPTLNEAAFYTDRSEAKLASKDLVTIYMDSDVRVIRARKTITAI